MVDADTRQDAQDADGRKDGTETPGEGPADRRGTSVRATVARTHWQRRRRAATRETILTAALRLFERDGYAAVTTRRIAREAGVSPITLFRHFPAKEDLVIPGPADDRTADWLRHLMDDHGRTRPIDFIRDILPRTIGTLEPAELEELSRRMRIIRGDATLTAALYARIPAWAATAAALWDGGGRAGRGSGADGFPDRLAFCGIISCAVTTLLEWSRRCDEGDGADPLDALAELADAALDATATRR